MTDTSYIRALADLKEIEFDEYYQHYTAEPEKRVLSPHSGDEFVEIHYDTLVRAISLCIAVERQTLEAIMEIRNATK